MKFKNLSIHSLVILITCKSTIFLNFILVSFWISLFSEIGLKARNSTTVFGDKLYESLQSYTIVLPGTSFRELVKLVLQVPKITKEEILCNVNNAKKESKFSWYFTAQKWTIPLRISSVNVTKSDRTLDAKLFLCTVFHVYVWIIKFIQFSLGIFCPRFFWKYIDFCIFRLLLFFSLQV